MHEQNTKLEELISSIIKIELNMFQRVRSVVPSLCQERPETFKVMRGMTYSVLSVDTLESYHEDLREAETGGRNLLTEKYARIDNLIPPLKTNALIDQLVEIETTWMEEFAAKHPHILQGQSAGFRCYLASELETYSDRTIDLYVKDVLKARKEGRNLAEERYETLAECLGYDSLADMELAIGKKSP
ncbi:MAG: DUF4125 family protein [Pseudomonadota bacterium]